MRKASWSPVPPVQSHHTEMSACIMLVTHEDCRPNVLRAGSRLREHHRRPFAVAPERVAVLRRRQGVHQVFAPRSDQPRQREEPSGPWRRPAVDDKLKQAFPDLSVGSYLRSTPIMIDGMLYTQDAHGFMSGLGTGATIWQQEPFARTIEEVTGQSKRTFFFVPSWLPKRTQPAPPAPHESTNP
jgi:hypothetical protein